MDLKKDRRFRRWVYNVWDDACQERLTWRDKPITIKEYWHTYKYWLKREYQYQRKQNGGSTARAGNSQD